MTPLWSRLRTDDVHLESHEDTLRPVIDGLFPDGGVFVDVGANMGLWSVPLGMRASKVVAVEANPATIPVLRENIGLNGLADVIEVLEIAAWDSDGELSLLNPSATGHPMAGVMRTVPPREGHQLVPCRRLDGVLKVDRIDLVKIDTEGADLHVLRGMTEHIARFRPVLFIEMHCRPPCHYYQQEELTGLVGSLGYTYREVTWATQHHLICRPA